MDDIADLREALEEARKEKARLQTELKQLRESLTHERRRLKKFVIVGLDDDRRLAKAALKRSADPLDQAIGGAERQASDAISRAVRRLKPDVLEFRGDIVDSSHSVSFEKPTPLDRFWVYVKGVHDLHKGQVGYGYASRLTVAALKELPNDFEIPPKPSWWKFSG